MKAFRKFAIISMLFAIIFSVIYCGNPQEPCEHIDDDVDNLKNEYGKQKGRG